MSTPIVRRRQLLAEIRRVGGRYTTGQAHAFYRATGWGPCRTTARKDLQWWARRCPRRVRAAQRPRLPHRREQPVRLRRAAHWAAFTAVALLAAEGVPFTGLHATATALVIAVAIGLLALAIAPQEDHR